VRSFRVVRFILLLFFSTKDYFLFFFFPLFLSFSILNFLSFSIGKLLLFLAIFLPFSFFSLLLLGGPSVYRSEDLSACVRSSLPRTLTRPTHFFSLFHSSFFLESYIPCYCGCCFLRWEKRKEKERRWCFLCFLCLLYFLVLLCLRVCFWLHSSPLLGLSLTHSLTNSRVFSHSPFPFLLFTFLSIYLFVCLSPLPCAHLALATLLFTPPLSLPPFSYPPVSSSQSAVASRCWRRGHNTQQPQAPHLMVLLCAHQ